jgi:lipopolysaccharide transport system ATP-binding protein
MDTPVKRYPSAWLRASSSGMYVRLAFAVAAHLEPEILLVDEVLAVGDAAFQKKCLGKMGDVAKEGRTVLRVQAGEDGGRISRLISSIRQGKLGWSKLMPGAGTRLCLMSGRTCL